MPCDLVNANIYIALSHDFITCIHNLILLSCVYKTPNIAMFILIDFMQLLKPLSIAKYVYSYVIAKYCGSSKQRGRNFAATPVLALPLFIKRFEK